MRRNKTYTVDERVAYHQKRLQSSRTTVDQKAYSRNWLDGFNDQFAAHNLAATQTELQQRKKIIAQREKEIAKQKAELQSIKTNNKVIFYSYINGANAKLKKTKLR